MALGNRDPLWVPLLSHYDIAAPAHIDRARTGARIEHISHHVRQFLIGGTTGDGWQFSSDILNEWLELMSDNEVLTKDHSFLVAAFGATTEEVVECAQHVEDYLSSSDLAAGFAGLTVCPPIDAKAGQAQIRAHFETILAATHSPIAIYQLPQITKCEIAPHTLSALLEGTSRITYFKDTSGRDVVVDTLGRYEDLALLRGAEGGYAGHLRSCGGRYDGWLLSTANCFAPDLREIINLISKGETEQASSRSKEMTDLVNAIFAIAFGLEEGNPFSNVNKAVDHIFAFGRRWRSVPAPRMATGTELSTEFMDRIDSLLDEHNRIAEVGYLAA